MRMVEGEEESEGGKRGERTEGEGERSAETALHTMIPIYLLAPNAKSAFQNLTNDPSSMSL